MTSSQDIFTDILARAERANFKIDEVFGMHKPFDFARPFLPNALSRTEELDFLSASERLVFNQIRGHAYLSIFGLVEEFILPFLLDHARTRLDSSASEVRALLQFAGEEAKHIDLFRRFRTQFQQGFGSRCDVIGPADEIARAILAHDPLSVALVILHIEWMTQAHYVESVHDDATLDDQFKLLLLCHWKEEAQHARMDTLIVEALAASYSAEQRQQALDGYFAIGGIIASGVAAQVELDLAAFVRKTGRVLSPDQTAQLRKVQLRANYFTYLGSGMTHPKFQRTLRDLGGDLLERVEQAAPSFC